MGRGTKVETRFREAVRRERERQGWSQAYLAAFLQSRGCPHILSTTVAKIENGDRAVRIDEAAVMADIFGVSVDSLLGRPINGPDLLWAISKLSSNAHKMVGEVAALQHRLRGDELDVRDYADRAGKLPDTVATLTAVGGVRAALAAAQKALEQLAGEFPLPGRA